MKIKEKEVVRVWSQSKSGVTILAEAMRPLTQTRTQLWPSLRRGLSVVVSKPAPPPDFGAPDGTPITNLESVLTDVDAALVTLGSSPKPQP